MTQKDDSKLLRFILHFSSLALGVGLLLNGIFRGVLLLLLPAFNVSFALKDVIGPNGQYDFFSFILLGILVVGIYHLWLAMAAKRGLIAHTVVLANEISITAILSAFVFWGGLAFLLYSILRAFSGVAPQSEIWAENTAAIIVGLVYIPLDLYLWRSNRIDPAVYAGARRGFVLAVLGAGMLAFAIGGATALFAWMTSLFGSPIPNWLQTTHSGLAACIVGGIVVALYLTTAIREHLFSSLTKRTPVAEAPAQDASEGVRPPITIESVLDELLAGKITRDEAAQRIRGLNGELVPANHSNQ